MSKVLVIDDDVGTTETFGHALRHAGFDVAVACSGVEGLRLALQPDVDLILADLCLPDVTGLEILSRLRRELVGVPFLIMTGFGSTASALEAGRLGAAAYVEKPLSLEELLALAHAHAQHSESLFTWGDKEVGGAATPLACRALRTIARRYTEPGLTIGLVARELGVSIEHLCRVIKEDTGHTFGHYLRLKRMFAARGLLRAQRLSVKEVAYQVGFNGTSHFDHVFKHACGVSPTDYRADRTQIANINSRQPISRDLNRLALVARRRTRKIHHSA
jgi:two-component system response regulator YesN